MTDSEYNSQWDSGSHEAGSFASEAGSFASEAGSSILASEQILMGSGSGGSAQEGFVAEGQHVAVFQLGGVRYALDVSFVGEVLLIEHATDVPLTPACILGVRNLRGSAIPVVDLAAVLDLAGEERLWQLKDGVTAVVLVLPGGIEVAVPIDAMEAVVPWHDSDLSANQVINEHSAVLGVLDLTKRGSHLVTLLDGGVLAEQLDSLKPQTASGE